MVTSPREQNERASIQKPPSFKRKKYSEADDILSENQVLQAGMFRCTDLRK
jgi:hypothetical protein